MDIGYLRDELVTIWKKYEPQRQMERDAARVSQEAAKDLSELNQRRLKAGLEMVDVRREQSLTQGVSHYVGWSTPKTWRDEMDAALLTAVKKYLESPTDM